MMIMCPSINNNSNKKKKEFLIFFNNVHVPQVFFPKQSDNANVDVTYHIITDSVLSARNHSMH